MFRRKRQRISSHLRFIVPNQFKMLLDSLKSQLEDMENNPTKTSFTILESLGGLVGRKTILEAVRWQQSDLVREIEADSIPKMRRKKQGRRLVTEVFFSPTFHFQGSSHYVCNCFYSFVYLFTALKVSYNKQTSLIIVSKAKQG